MKGKKVMALILAAALTAGCCMTAFAADTAANSADSEGTSFEHVNKDVIDVTFPTDSQVATVFDYYVDPEGAIKSAGTLLNGTAVTGNDDGVYFVNKATDDVDGTVSCTIAGQTGATATVDDLSVNETYTYKIVAAVDGTVSCTIAGKDGATATVSDLSVNQTYTYDAASGWLKEDDSAAGVTITVTASDGNTTITTFTQGDEVVVSGAKAEVKGWQKADGSAATGVTITVKESDGSTAIDTFADGDKVVVSGAAAAAPAGYSSSSDAVKFEGKNSVDVDITVAATVTATNADKDIALVADEAALAAATSPALLMTLKVGSDTKVITSAGTSAKATIAGIAGNFVMKPNAGNTKFVFALKDAADLAAWNSTTVQLVGKTNSKDIPAGENAMTVPKITLTWTVTKSSTTTTPSGPSASGSLSTSNKSVTVSGLGENVTLKSASLVKTDNSSVLMTSGTHYRFSDGAFTVIKETHLNSASFKSWVLTFSDDSTVTIPIVAAQ